MVDDLCFLPAQQLASLIRRGELSPLDLVDALLERIRREDPALHAFIEVYEEEVRAGARTLGNCRCDGTRLFGIPVAVKDLVDVSGRATTVGSVERRGHIAPNTAAAVRRLIEASALILGKTHMVEFALGGWGINHTMGSPQNPWDRATHRAAGGSSSGSAVAVAAGLVPLSLGSDTGGSIRVPAAFCGIVGLKPTFGRISNDGVAPLSATLDTLGPMTRSVEDAALLFGVMADDPDIVDHIQAPIEGIRLAVPTPGNLAVLGVEAEVAQAFCVAADALQDLGATVDEVDLSDLFATSIEGTATIIAAEAYALHRGWICNPARRADPVVRDRLLAAKSVSAADYRDAIARRPRALATYLSRLTSQAALIT